MKQRKVDTELIGTRVTPAVRQVVEAAAAEAGQSVAAWLRALILREVGDAAPAEPVPAVPPADAAP